MASELNIGEINIPSQQIKGDSVSSNKKIIKSGTSEAITITKEAEMLDKHQGDELLVRLSIPSVRTMVADRIVDEFLYGDYKPRNSQVSVCEVIHTTDSRLFNEEDVFDVEQVSKLYNEVMKSLDSLMDHYVDDNLLIFDSEISSYERSIFTEDRIKLSQYDEDEKKIRRELRKCIIWFKFIHALMCNNDFTRTSFKMTRDPQHRIFEAIHVCESALRMHEDELKEFIKKENIEWGIRQAAILDKDGYYVVVKVLRGSLASFADDQYEESVKMDVFHSFSYEQLDSAMSEEMTKMARSNSNGSRYDYQIYGPFLENDAKQFKEYLYIGVKLNFKAYDSSSIFEWCRNQSEQYKQSRIKG